MSNLLVVINRKFTFTYRTYPVSYMYGIGWMPFQMYSQQLRNLKQLSPTSKYVIPHTVSWWCFAARVFLIVRLHSEWTWLQHYHWLCNVARLAWHSNSQLVSLEVDQTMPTGSSAFLVCILNCSFLHCLLDNLFWWCFASEAKMGYAFTALSSVFIVCQKNFCVLLVVIY